MLGAMNPTFNVPGHSMELLTPEYTALVAFAAKISANAHQFQVDKSGQPYILHPTRVAMQGRNGPEIIVGYLHDVLEDCPAFWKDILKTRFIWGTNAYPDIWEALLAITKAPHEPNKVYIERVMQYNLSRQVKIHDVRDNMLRLGLLDESTQKRLFEKYAHELAILTDTI